jgi:putative tricarboxylic transport membrane protein
VAGPEAANNSAVTATLVPLLTLGIPTSVTAAILLSALQNYGIRPGRNCSRPRPRWCGR